MHACTLCFHASCSVTLIRELLLTTHSLLFRVLNTVSECVPALVDELIAGAVKFDVERDD